VRMIPSSFHFSINVFVPGKSPVKVQPEILDSFFLGELRVVYMDWEGGGTFLFM
jgi:hypothetical protein